MKRFEHLERGFTLMELMVVIVIVAILAAVAVPLYINYVNDARYTEAKGAIGAIVTAEQTYFQQHGAYVDATWDRGVSTTNGLNCDLEQATTNWKFQVTASNGDTSFVAVATGQAGGDYASLHPVTYTYHHSSGGSFDR
jgi:prepilin-type N-terminal cleavage/methylation domain-containing protein